MAESRSKLCVLVLNGRFIRHRKKSSKSKSKSDKERVKQKDRDQTKELLLTSADEPEASGSSVARGSGSPKPIERKTAAERRFEEIQKQRVSAIHRMQSFVAYRK